MEKESRLSGALAFFTCLMIPLMLCAAALVFFGASGGLNGFALPGGSSPQASVKRLAVIGEDGNVYLMDSKGENRVSITSDAVLERSAPVRRIYAFPNWSPNSQRLAFVGVSSENDGTAFVYVAEVKGAKPNAIFTSADDFPFYLSWSPDSQRVAFLAQNNDEMTFNYASADGSESKTLGKGSPLYFSWSPDSRTLISHVGGSRRQSADAFIGVHTLGAAEDARHLAIAPANFPAPAWAPNGKEVLTALMGTSAANDALVISDEQGEHQRTLIKFSGGVAFNWSPDGIQIAYLTSQRSNAGFKSELHSIKSDGSDDQLLSDESPLAFFWSPDGARIAYVVLARGDQGALQETGDNAQQPTLRLTWKVLTIRDKQIASLNTFVPTDAFAALIPYFDQYAQSLRIWSPDSQLLTYAADEKDGTQAVYLVSANGGEEPRRVTTGSIAVWSWR